jgi:hypothetical protein
MITAKYSEAPDLYRLADMIAMLKNSHLFWDLRNMEELEQKTAISELETEMAELMG